MLPKALSRFFRQDDIWVWPQCNCFLDKSLPWPNSHLLKTLSPASPFNACSYALCGLDGACSAKRLSDTELGFPLNTPLAIMHLCLYQAVLPKLLPERHPCPFPTYLPEKLPLQELAQCAPRSGTLQTLLDVPIATAAGFHLQISHCLAFVF